MDMERIEQAAYNEGYRKGYEQGKADAVSVVRCRECKWYGGDGWESDESKRRHWCNRVSEWGKCIHVNADDFCSYGERKGE